MMQVVCKKITVLIFCMASSLAYAAPSLLEELVSRGEYTGPSVEDNIRLMDTDKNGFADVYEVRAFLALKHGANYEKETLDRWQAESTSKSCGSSFSKSLYSN